MLAVIEFEVAGIGVEAEFGVDQVAMVLDQPVHAVRISVFFVRGEGHDDVAVRLPALLLPANHVGGEDGVAVLHVLGTAAVEVAVFFD